MASITYFSQLSPSPRSPSVAASLAARVRDPAWLLARQWQLGEFAGADAGTPAFTQIASHDARLASAKIGAATLTLNDTELFEPLVQAEPLTPDLGTAVELGQSFEALLADAHVANAVRDQFRVAYPIAPAGPTTDATTAAFLRVCSGRAVDGAALYAAVVGAPARLPAQPVLARDVQGAVLAVLQDFVNWVSGTWGGVGTNEPAAWDATRLEYRASVGATPATGGSLTLAAHPDSQADLDWYAFDLTDTTAGAATTTAGTPLANRPLTTSVIPGHVRFRGMPNARFWDFEGSKTDFGAVVPDGRDLAKLLFMDFMLLHGDDWYLAPLEVATGSLCFIDTLNVTDVFGVNEAIARADAAPAGARWTAFSTSDTQTSGLAPFLVVPSTAAAARLASAPIEDVHLLRDETADMAWAIEHIVEGPTGVTLPESPPPSFKMPTDVPAALVYRLATPLPASWFPLLPTSAGGSVALVAGTVEGAGPPQGRIVRRLSVPGFQLPDAEVPRGGIRVQRLFCRARSASGDMQLWVARRTQYGAGAASSGLRYDDAAAATPAGR